MASREKKTKFSIIFISAMILCVLFYCLQLFIFSEKFLPGVYIAGVPVGGKSIAQAVTLTQEKVESYYQNPIKFVKGNFEYRASFSDICDPVTPRKAVEEIWNKEKARPISKKAISIIKSDPINYEPELHYDMEKLEEMSKIWNEELKVGVKNAYLEVSANAGLKIVPGEPGLTVDREGTKAELPEFMNHKASSEVKVPIVLKEEQPSITEKDLANMGEIAIYTTKFNPGDINRTKNLKLAASSINGQMIKKDEEFQFNRTVGKRTLESGYSDALVIVGDKFEPGLGGGVCQVSSTLYNACLLAGLEIVERHNHGLAVSYVPVSLDATVVYGLQDFRFKNNSSSAIYLRAAVDGNQLTVNIYGNLKDKKNIKLSSVIDKVHAFAEIIETKPSLQPGQRIVDHSGSPGYNSRAFQSFYDEAGGLILSKQLSSDHYRPLNKLIFVGPEPAVTETPVPIQNGDEKKQDNMSNQDSNKADSKPSNDAEGKPSTNGMPVDLPTIDL